MGSVSKVVGSYARPFFDVDVARVSRISDRFEQFVEARDAATVL
jgi:hypothetical protein